MTEVSTIRNGLIEVGPDAKMLLLAGLCIVEDEETTLRHASRLQEELAGLELQLVFKSSYDKANRSSIHSHRGPGMDRGLEILAKVKAETGLPIVTDVHETYQVEAAAAVADIIQIPAFLCRPNRPLGCSGPNWAHD